MVFDVFQDDCIFVCYYNRHHISLLTQSKGNNMSDCRIGFDQETQSDLEQLLPPELISLMLCFLNIRDLGLLTQVNRYIHQLVDEDLLWKWRCGEYHPSAVQQIKDHYKLEESWKEIYHRLTEATEMARLRLEKYYLDLNDYWGHCNRRYYTNMGIPAYDVQSQDVTQTTGENLELARKMIIFSVAGMLHGWAEEETARVNALITNTNDSRQLGIEMIRQDNVNYADYHCQLFAAAATGNEVLVLELLQERTPYLDDIFNFAHFKVYYRNDFFHTDKQHPIWKFPQKMSLINFGVGEPSLVYFARFYGQQLLLDAYYQIALSKGSEEDRLKWAIICHQPQKIVLDLLEAGLDINRKKRVDIPNDDGGVDSRFFLPLHFAAIWEDGEIIQLLIQRGANVANLSEIQQDTLIYPLIVNNRSDIVVELIDRGMKIIGLNKNSFLALTKGDFEILSRVAPTLTPPVKKYMLRHATAIAFYRNEPEMLQSMLAFCPNTIPSYEEFLWAACSGRDQIVELVIKERLKAKQELYLLRLSIHHAIVFEDTDILRKVFDIGLDITFLSKSFILSEIKSLDFRAHSEVNHQVRDLLLDEFKRQRLSMSAWHQATSLSFWSNNVEDQLNELEEKIGRKGCVLF